MVKVAEKLARQWDVEGRANDVGWRIDFQTLAEVVTGATSASVGV